MASLHGICSELVEWGRQSTLKSALQYPEVCRRNVESAVVVMCKFAAFEPRPDSFFRLFLPWLLLCVLSFDLTCREFVRYRLRPQCALVGALQLGAAIGLVAGLSQPWLGRAAAAGLALMMLVAPGSGLELKTPCSRRHPRSSIWR